MNELQVTNLPHVLGDVSDDWQAVEVWLETIATRSNKPESQTVLTYQYHLQKVRWYCENIVMKTPSRWDARDVMDFIAFLKDLPLSAIRTAGTKKGMPAWTPFKVQPSPSSQSDIRRFVQSMYQAWHKAGYIRINPMVLLGARGMREVNPKRSIPSDLFQIVLGIMQREIPRTFTESQLLVRDRFILTALRDLGLRATELVEAKMTAFEPFYLQASGKTYWIFRVVADSAKGFKSRTIPVTKNVWDSFVNYRMAFGLQDVPLANLDCPMLLSPRTSPVQLRTGVISTLKARRYLNSWKSINTRQGLYVAVKARLSKAANYLDEHQRHSEAELLREASPHWLRHSFGKESLIAGQSMREVAGALGHSNLNTTMIYTEQETVDLLLAWERELNRPEFLRHSQASRSTAFHS